MATRFSLKVGANFKHSLTKPELTDDVTAALSAVTWVLPATLLKLNGWLGFAVSFVTTWGIGAAFNIPGMRRGAFAIGATQLMYTHGSKFIEDTFSTPVWRFDDQGGLSGGVHGVRGLGSLAAAIQSGAQMAVLPDGTQAVAYPGVNGWAQGSEPAQLRGLGAWTGANPPGDKVAAATPMFSTSPW